MLSTAHTLLCVCTHARTHTHTGAHAHTGGRDSQRSARRADVSTEFMALPTGSRGQSYRSPDGMCLGHQSADVDWRVRLGKSQAAPKTARSGKSFTSPTSLKGCPPWLNVSLYRNRMGSWAKMSDGELAGAPSPRKTPHPAVSKGQGVHVTVTHARRHSCDSTAWPQPEDCKRRGAGHTTGGPAGTATQRPPPSEDSWHWGLCVTPLAPSHDNLITGTDLQPSLPGWGPQSGASARPCPPTQRPSGVGPSTHLVRVVQQQRLRDHGGRQQGAEGREPGAGCRLQLHPHGLSDPTHAGHSRSPGGTRA